VKTGWTSTRLEQLCTVFTDGDWIESKDQSPEGVRLVQTGNVGNGEFKDRIEKARYISEATFDRLRCTELRPGDCLISRLPDPVGRSCLIPMLSQRAITAVDCTIIRFEPSKLTPDFFVYFSQSAEYSDQVERLTGGATRQRISRKNLGQIIVPLPPLEEQRRIVAVLDEAFAAIATATANAEKNVANARELFSGKLRHLFSGSGSSWEWKALGDVADARLGKMLDKRKNKGTLRPYLRNINVRWFEFDLSNCLEMRFESFEEGRYSAIKGDLLLVEGGYPGRCAIWEGSEPIYFQKAIHRVRFSDPRLAKILMYMLFAQDGDGTLKRYFTGSGIQHLTAQSLAKIPVPLPPVNERDAIVSQIETLFSISEDAQRIYRAKLAHLLALKKSLLQRAFSGKLTVVDVKATDNDFTTPAFTANVIAFAYRRHADLGTENTFGRVKAQKALHLCETVGGVDLGRRPMKDAAGPNDFQHMLAAENWAKANQFFQFELRRNGNGYTFKKLARFDILIADGMATLKPVQDRLEKAIGLITRMNSQQAELLTTVHAAWNNLILDGTDPADTAIVHEARENWHADKLKIAEAKFHDAIQTIRTKRILPDGTGKRVGGQERLF
jgi:restriction endonuclease S subunit